MAGDPCTTGIGGSFLHWMTASSSVTREGFRRPEERLEERREEGEKDLKEVVDELVRFSAEVMICNAVDVGRLLLPLEDPSVLGETGVTESIALNL